VNGIEVLELNLLGMIEDASKFAVLLNHANVFQADAFQKMCHSLNGSDDFPNRDLLGRHNEFQSAADASNAANVSQLAQTVNDFSDVSFRDLEERRDSRNGLPIRLHRQKHERSQ